MRELRPSWISRILLPMWAAALILYDPVRAELAAPAVAPEQTVNLATGEMSFNLPLGTVRGVNGHNYPINLTYSAGIRADEAASAVGLGFNVGVGGISRKVVFVPDDFTGDDKYVYSKSPDDDEACHDEWDTGQWVIFVVRIIAKALFGVLDEIGAMCSPLGMVMDMVLGMAQDELAFHPEDWRAGGVHCSTYDFSQNNGRGFFKGGDDKDLPDVYFISTPYLSGQLVWVGSPDEGRFVLKRSTGGRMKT